MATQKTVTVTKLGGGESKVVPWKDGLDAGTAVMNAGFGNDIEQCSITVNGKAGNRETRLEVGASVQLAAKVANG